MRYMLDTCAFIDAVTEPDNWGADVCALMEETITKTKTKIVHR